MVVVSGSVTTVSPVVSGKTNVEVVTIVVGLAADTLVVAAGSVVVDGPTIVTVCVKLGLGTVATLGPLAGSASDGPQV
jgi:hypothetical protein